MYTIRQSSMTVASYNIATLIIISLILLHQPMYVLNNLLVVYTGSFVVLIKNQA